MSDFHAISIHFFRLVNKIRLNMALVCDFKSENSHMMTESSIEDSLKTDPNTGDTPGPDENQKNDSPQDDDLEDGEIEDDDEEDPTEPVVSEPQQQILGENPRSRSPSPVLNNKNNKFGHPGGKPSRFDRADRRGNNRYEERKHGHLTEAEKSVLHLRKLERQEREKRERYKREQNPVVDDFASNIEKAIANVLKKDKKGGSDDEKDEEEKRGKKRKKKDKDKRKNKLRKVESPNLDEMDETELLNMRKGGSPDQRKIRTRSSSPHSPSEFDSRESSPGSDRSREERKEPKSYKKEAKKKNNERNRNDKRKRDHKTDIQQNKEGGAQGMLCTFYMQGKCTKGDDCQFSHGVSAPIKMELCKFYLMDCCAKGDKCLYMHSQFPCKFYHTGIVCKSGDFCKFSHGKPLSEAHKQILFKHIETAPKEILGEFPRLTREDALNMINSTQKSLEGIYGVPKNEMASEGNRAMIPSLFDINVSVPTGLLAKNAEKEKNEKPAGRERSRPSRWQSNDKDEQQQQVPMVFGLSGFYSERGDQDMRVTSNGDIDMRTLPPTMNSLNPNVTQASVLPLTTETNSIKDIASQDVDIRKESRDVDIRQLNVGDNRVNALKDVDTRVYPQFDTHLNSAVQDLPEKMEADEPKLTIVEDHPVQNDAEPKVDVDNRVGKEIDLPPGMPKIQRDLFLRIQAQQKENLPEAPLTAEPDDDQTDIDWYSDDDENRLTIKDDPDDVSEKDEIEEPPHIQLPSPIKPMEVIEQLGDLSKIDISEEVTKLLSSISQATSIKEPTKEPLKDPRVARTGETVKASTPSNDPRRARVNSTDHEKTEKVERISIYEQGSISIENASKDVDLRGSHDSDLRPTFGDTDLRPPPGRPDIDLRQLGLPFKPMQNYTPATEIDGTLGSHPPIVWKVNLIYIPQPDYAGLKLSAHEAQNTGDPRLRKLFKLNIDEKDSPASPKESPKAVVTGIRADPRRRKQEEKAAMNELNYSQQLTMLQTSAFYQSLTSNQKLLLNQELSSRSDHTGTNDPALHGILATLGLIAVSNNISPTNNATALNILTNVNNLNPMLGQPAGFPLAVPTSIGFGQNQPFVSPGQVNPNMMAQNPNMVNQIAQGVQPGLLGNGPNVPIVNDFQLNFDPRQGGLLGNAPPIGYDNSNYNNYGGDDFYEGGNNYVEDNGGGNRGRGRGRGNFRDRQRRGGQNFRGGRNNGRNFRNRNRVNRSQTPP